MQGGSRARHRRAALGGHRGRRGRGEGQHRAEARARGVLGDGAEVVDRAWHEARDGLGVGDGARAAAEIVAARGGCAGAENVVAASGIRGV